MQVQEISEQDKIHRSKLKRDCVHYHIAVHGIRCCSSTGEFKLFTRVDQCQGCSKYKSSNKDK